jgi:hypothetical protein
VDIELKYEFRNVFSINWTNNFTILIDISAFKFDKHLFGSEILNVVSAYQFLPLSDVREWSDVTRTQVLDDYESADR